MSVNDGVMTGLSQAYVAGTDENKREIAKTIVEILGGIFDTVGAHGLTLEEYQLLNTENKRIAAIKSVKKRTGLGLKDAVHLTDSFRTGSGL